MNKAKLYKLSNTVISFIIGSIAVYFIYENLFKKEIAFDWLTILGEIKNSYYILILVALLMVFNWTMEIIKWNLLIKRIQALTVKQLIESLNLGILLSLITPNRIGELGGRQLYIKKENRVTSLYIQSFGAISQLTVTLVFGLLALIFLSNTNQAEYNLPQFNSLFISCLIVFIVIFFLFSNQLGRFVFYLKRKITKKPEAKKFMKISKTDRLKIFSLSVVRYLVFCSQFIMLYFIFEKEVSELVFWSLALTYLITAVIPTAWISDLLVRTSVIFYVFNLFLLNGKFAMIASMLLWCINLMIPALFGLLSLNKVNWRAISTLKYKK